MKHDRFPDQNDNEEEFTISNKIWRSTDLLISTFGRTRLLLCFSIACQGLRGLGETIDEFIRISLGEKTLQKIERRLFEKYRISVKQAVGEFEMLHAVLFEFFGDSAQGLERRILENYKFDSNANNSIKKSH